MSSYNYKYLSSRRKPTVLQNEKQLPEGEWVLISEAAKVIGCSTMTIRWKFLREEIESYCIKDGPMLVNLDEITF